MCSRCTCAGPCTTIVRRTCGRATAIRAPRSGGLDERKARPGGVDQFFLSHPLEENRIAATQALIATYPPDAVRGLTKDSPNFQAFKKRLQSLPPSPPSKR